MDPNTLNLKNNQSPTTGTSSTTGASLPETGTYSQKPSTSTHPIFTPSPQDEAVLDDIQKELRTRFELLPKEIQDTIISSEYQMKLFELAKKYKISYADLGQLELETTMVLLGMTKPDEFEESLAESIPKDKASIISPLVKEIDIQVFSAIRTQLVELYEEKNLSREIPSPISTPVVPLSQELASATPNALPNFLTDGVVFEKPEPVHNENKIDQIEDGLEKQEKDMLKDSGVEIRNTPFNNEIPKDAFTSKLTGIFGVKSASTDHTLPKMSMADTTPPPSTPRVDPYKEPL